VILIDAPFAWPGKRGTWCHLVSDTSRAELHAFAARLGIKRCWYSGRRPHYDLHGADYERALSLGATPATRVQISNAWKRLRA
jgi:hypothetical protein